MPPGRYRCYDALRLNFIRYKDIVSMSNVNKRQNFVTCLPLMRNVKRNVPCKHSARACRLAFIDLSQKVSKELGPNEIRGLAKVSHVTRN